MPVCSAQPPQGAVPATPDRISRLAGRFRLTQVVTSYDAEPYTTELLLVAPDSAARAHALVRSIGHYPRRDLRLLGTWWWSSKYPAQEAEWDAGTLYLGCRDCLDGSPDHLQIKAIMGRRFWGSWGNSQSGIGKIVDKTGKPVPDPNGYFCAEPFDKAS